MNKVLPIFMFLFVMVAFNGCIKVVEDGKVGVKFTLGKISDDPLGTGIHFYIPIVSHIESWNVKTHQQKQALQVPSNEGLIVGMDISVLMRVPKENVVKIRKTIGSNYTETVVVPYIRESARAIVSGYAVKSLYSDKGRTEISIKMLNVLKDKLGKKGIEVEDVLLRDVKLPPTFLRSIETKLTLEQQALQKEFELVKAKKDAEIEVERAKGVAESNKIISVSINENYLRYLWINALKEGNSEVIYVPTEANLPILEANRFNQEKKTA